MITTVTNQIYIPEVILSRLKVADRIAHEPVFMVSVHYLFVAEKKSIGVGFMVMSVCL